MDNANYTIYQRINEPQRLLGCSIPEIVTVFFIIVFAWTRSCLLTGFVVSALFIGCVRYLRGDQGKGWFLSLCYWYLPGDFFVFLKGTPLSYKRFWIS